MIEEYKKMKWFFIWVLLLAGGMVFSNMSGYRVFSSGGQQQWKAGGPGLYHK
ncbi:MULTISPECIES: hypothetical protein [Niastella]|uniref:Uncharacterized protein n=1 Tax=Niastella soli TaxID=2821487 RepID=A0ABS3YSN8_9BACT|nr:hypothetical protein [Niastella soli]MBO9200900.1 hypothetical protein [Niastella soli]